MIEKLRKAGLGYNVSERDTADKFGKRVTSCGVNSIFFN